MNTKFHLQWLGLTAVLFLLLAALAPGSPAHADSCLVTTGADSGPGSLREKIANSACDPINFDGDYNIVLASQLIIGRNVTIDGVGHGVTVSGNHAVRGFYVDSGVTLNLNNLTVANGNVGTSGVGGGIYNRGTLNVTNGAFSGNNAALGGGIYSDGDALTVTSSTFTGNSATYSGGGINTQSTLNVTTSTFSGNSATYGGGISSDIGTTNVANSTFTNNSATWDGGGIYVHSGTVTVASSNFSGNNRAELGAGIFNASTLSVANSTFSGNSAQFAGGGIYNNTGTVTLTNSTFSSNSVGFGSGGGICNNAGTVTLTNTTFSSNSAMNSGGIYNTVGTVMLTNSTISGNLGSGVTNNNAGTAMLTNTILANNGGGNCINYEGTLSVSSSLADDESCGPGFYSSSILLGPLADNGGPTLTMALLPGSAAIDAGDDAVCPATDQRGVTRPQGTHCDTGAYEAEVITENTAPIANPGGPYLGAVNTAIAFDGSGSTDADGDPLTSAWTFGDGGTATDAMPTHSYVAAQVYDVCLTVNDGMVDSPQACTMAVVYDPSAGFVTGGGWINSPAGAYMLDPILSGKATFGFVSKYQKGAQVPTGNTQFQFDVAGFSFYSETYEWLVVNQGSTNAQFKGSGTINDGLDPNGNEYKFMIWAGDGSPDTLRIRIWWEADGVETDVYDNGAEQAIGAGNIVVHTK